MNQTQVSTVAQAAQTIAGAKPAQSSVAQATQPTTVAGAKYVLTGRPSRGNALFAHTAAAFAALGLDQGAAVPRNTMLRVWGETALKYHADKFNRGEGGYSLNDFGFSFFQEAREVDPEMAAIFYKMLTEGKGGESLPRAYQGLKPL